MLAGSFLVMATACPLNGANDFTETFTVSDPIHRIEIAVSTGNIDAITTDRETMAVKRHTFGFTNDLPSPDFSIEDGVYRFEAHCIRSDFCTWDHMLEVPLGVGFDIRMTEAYVNLGKTDSDVTAEFEVGRFKGTRLAVPNLTLNLGSVDVLLEYTTAPETVSIEVASGDVSLAVPAGSYQCSFAADAGEVATSGITCDDAATAVLAVHVGSGDVTVTAAAAP